MKNPLLLAGLTLTFASAALPAQQVVVPEGMTTSNPGSTTLAWRNQAFRFQMLYDQSHWLDQGINQPIVISRIQYRASGGATSPGGETYNGVTIQMSTSPNDWSAASTTFANNVGTDVTTVFSGNITATAAAGGSPNDYILDIALQTPFTYDPSSGMDLCIDVDAPNDPAPATLPSFAASSSSAHMARRISTTTVGSPTGSLSYFACVVLADYTFAPNAALATPYGEGCVAEAVSFYEQFDAGAFDLAGSAGVVNSIQGVPSGTGYAVSQGSNTWTLPTSLPVTIGDDEVVAANLPFTFNYPGGSTTAVGVCSNGFVYLDPAATSTASVGTIAGLLAGEARLCGLWMDLDPSAGGFVFIETSPTSLTVTWELVPLFNIPASLNTMQMVLNSDGSFEFRYQDMNNGPGVCGFAPGNNPRDGGLKDISADIPFVTAADNYPLALVATSRPKLSSTLNLEIRDIPASGTNGVLAFGFTQLSVDLGVIQMPGCFQLHSYDLFANFTVTGSTESFQIPIPNAPVFIGTHIYGQAAVAAPGENQLGVVTSNGIDFLFDVN